MSTPPRSADRLATLFEYLLLSVAIAYIILYAAIAVSRMRYPFDLEWMEGGLVEHVRRILNGQPIYAAPSIEYVPFLYPPFFYYVSSVVARVTGIGPFPLRLVSFASSLGCLWLLYRMVSRETASRWLGVVCAGIFAATYRLSGAWLDLARVDALFLLLVLGTLYLLRFGGSARSWILAGVLLGCAGLTKQTASMVGVPIALWAVIVDRRKGLLFALAAVAVFGAATITLNLMNDGWYWWYIVRMPARIQVGHPSNPNFWGRDLIDAVPIAVALSAGYLLLGAVYGSRSTSFYYAALAAAMVGASWGSRLHVGAFDNVLIPAYACLAMLMTLAIHQLQSFAAPASRPAVRVIAAILGTAQLAALGYNPLAQIPGRQDLARQEELIQRFRDTNGEVYLSEHSFYPLLAGKQSYAHSWAIYDVVRAGDENTRERLLGHFRQALADRKFQLIVLDDAEPWFKEELLASYHLAGPVFTEDGLWTVTGNRTRPQFVYVPREP